MKQLSLPFALLFALTTAASAADRPNVVWIVSEDNSVHYLQHFFPGGAPAPNIEALAKSGLTYNHAFSNAPVCSVARTTLATCCYGPRIGTQFHRRYKMAPMPEGVRMFPAYLREAGYYATNNSKKDYNAVEGNGVWDESSGKASWRNRPDKSQPFFHMQSHGSSHESSLHFGQSTYENEKTATDPGSVPLADYFPDTPLFRYTHARYLDRMAVIDGIVGDTVAKLEEDGLLEDTFVFYFGDHGGVLPRGKGYIYESGLHVPLVVRVPENFKHLADAKRGSRIDGFVSFIDFGPTVLRLAGVDVPERVDGRAFLGEGISMKEVNTRDEAFGYADRFDEKYDLIRSVRKGKYQYIRNYQPYLPDGLQNNYRYKMLAYKEWRELFKAGTLSGPQLQFFQPKPAEMLFDVEADPHEVNNLAGDPKYADVLAKLRDRLQEIVKGLPDLSFYPESYLVANTMENPVAFGQSQKAEIATLVDTADLALLPFEQAEPKIEKALKSDNPLVRYWASMVCSAFGKEAAGLADQVTALLKDDCPIVRVRAAEFVGVIGHQNPQPALTEIVNTTNDPIVATEALNSVVLFRDFFDDRYPVARSDFHPVCRGADIDDRLNYINGIPYPRKAPKPKKVGKKKGESSAARDRTATKEITTISDRMGEFVKDGQIAGAVTLVASDDKILHLSAVGQADIEAERPMQADTVFAIASMTKPITATAVLILQDEGKLSVGDPVSKYIPQFKEVRLGDEPPSREITICDLMTHTSGIGGSQQNQGTLKRTAELLAGQPLKFQPGSKWAYSPGMTVCGRIIEVASGQPYEEFLAERIFRPLKMTDTTFFPTKEQQERLARIYRPGPEKGTLAPATHWLTDLVPQRTPNPSGGLFSTAADLARFYQMVVNGGELNGQRIVSEKAVAQMTRVQTPDLTTGFTPGNGWGLGWCVVRQPQEVTAMLSPGAFGHGGAFGTQGWVDPKRKLIFVLMIQRTAFGNSDGASIRGEFQRLAVDSLAK